MVFDVQGMFVVFDGVLLKDKVLIQCDLLVMVVLGIVKLIQGLWVFDGKLLWVSVYLLLCGGIVQGVLVVVQVVGELYLVIVMCYVGVFVVVVVFGGVVFVVVIQYVLLVWVVFLLFELVSIFLFDDMLLLNGCVFGVFGVGCEQFGWVLFIDVLGGWVLMFMLGSDWLDGVVVCGELLFYGVIVVFVLIVLLVSVLGNW